MRQYVKKTVVLILQDGNSAVNVMQPPKTAASESKAKQNVMEEDSKQLMVTWIQVMNAVEEVRSRTGKVCQSSLIFTNIMLC